MELERDGGRHGQCGATEGGVEKEMRRQSERLQLGEGGVLRPDYLAVYAEC